MLEAENATVWMNNFGSRGWLGSLAPNQSTNRSELKALRISTSNSPFLMKQTLVHSPSTAIIPPHQWLESMNGFYISLLSLFHSTTQNIPSSATPQVSKLHWRSGLSDLLFSLQLRRSSGNTPLVLIRADVVPPDILYPQISTLDRPSNV